MSSKALIESEYKICNGNRDDIEVFHVKLTDSALKSLENFSRKQSKPIQLNIDGTRGTLAIRGKQSFDSFDLSISPLHYTTDGALDFVQLQGNRVISLGKPVTRLTVQGNDDSFHAAKQRMAEAEKDQRKCQSKAPYLTNTKRPGIRDATMNPRSVPTPPGSRIPDSRISPSLANVRSFSPLSANSYKSPVTSIADMSSRPIRDRIVHLLAVRSYQRPELILRLQRGGLTEENKELVDGILNKVGKMGRQGEYSLLPQYFNLVEPTWPGFSPSEKIMVTSLKAKYQPASPNTASRVTPNSRQNSPISAASADDFGRKPTRASAPSAPHPLQKKIAALDLLSTGTPEATVASRHGITTTLLEQWKNSEATLRQRFSQRQGSTIAQSTVPPHSSTQDSLNLFQTKPRNSAPTSINAGAMSTATVVAAAATTTKNSVCNGDSLLPLSQPPASKRKRLSSSSGESNSGNSTGSCPSFASNPSRRNKPPSPVIDHGQAASQPIPPPQPAPALSVSASMKRSYPMETFSKTPLQQQGAVRSHHRHSRRPPRDCGSETSSCGDSSGISMETPPLPQFNGRANDADGDKQRLASFGEDKISDVSDEDYLSDSISSKTAELERLYPAISSSTEAAQYREEFEELYPEYIRLYEPYREAWNTVANLKRRILAAMDENGDTVSRLAAELDDFLKTKRTPARREDEMRLLVMTHKLQLIKDRLAAYNQGGDSAKRRNGVSGQQQQATQQTQPRNGLVRATVYE